MCDHPDAVYIMFTTSKARFKGRQTGSMENQKVSN